MQKSVLEWNDDRSATVAPPKESSQKKVTMFFQHQTQIQNNGQKMEQNLNGSAHFKSFMMNRFLNLLSKSLIWGLKEAKLFFHVCV